MRTCRRVDIEDRDVCLWLCDELAGYTKSNARCSSYNTQSELFALFTLLEFNSPVTMILLFDAMVDTFNAL